MSLRFWRPLAVATVVVLLGGCTGTPDPPPPATATATSSASPTASPTATATPTPDGTIAASTATPTSTSVIVPPSPEGTKYNFTCAEGKTFSILAYPAAQERVTLMIEGKTLELKQERSGSGTRHSDGNYTLIQKGVDAFIEQNGVQTYRDCKASRP